MPHRIRLLIIIALSLAKLSGSAVPQGLAYGLRAGPSFSRFVGDPGWSFRAGYLAGVLGRLQVHGALAIQPELLVHRRGANSQQFGGSKVILTYLEVPSLARLRLYGGSDKAVEVAAYAGPTTSVQLSCQYAQEDPDPYSPEPPGILVPCASRESLVSIGIGFTSTRNVMIDALGGIELVIPLSRTTSLLLDSRYQRSLPTIDRLGLPDAWTETLVFSFAIIRSGKALQ